MVKNGSTDSLYYTYCDYQGNILAVTDALGNVKEKLAYDPWGLRRSPSNWTQTDSRTSFLFSRGYTMHEHLDDFGLINMNGRVYDPIMAQFLSPDPFIQAPGNWYNYNRYGYCYNNPLMYNDPNGYFFKWLGRKLNKFGRWLGKSFDNLGDFLTKNNISIGVGVNMTPGGGPTTYNVSINGRQVFNSANGNQFNPAVNVERGLNQMRFLNNLNPNSAIISHIVNPSGAKNYYRMNGVEVDLQNGALYFHDRKMAYDYMWAKSFYNENGNFGPAREVSGWELRNGGTIVMPYYENTLRESRNHYLKYTGNGAGFQVNFNNTWYPVKTHTHSHPDYYGGEIGLSGSPARPRGDYYFLMFTGFDHINIMYDNKIHMVEYNWYKKNWRIKNSQSW